MAWISVNSQGILTSSKTWVKVWFSNHIEVIKNDHLPGKQDPQLSAVKKRANISNNFKGICDIIYYFTNSKKIVIKNSHLNLQIRIDMRNKSIKLLKCKKKIKTTSFNCVGQLLQPAVRDGQNHHILMILKSKSNHLNKGDLKSKSISFWKWWFENRNQNHIENQIILSF